MQKTNAKTDATSIKDSRTGSSLRTPSPSSLTSQTADKLSIQVNYRLLPSTNYEKIRAYRLTLTIFPLSLLSELEKL